MSTITIVILLLLNLFKEYLLKYFGKKGENLATKEDVEEITKITESIKAEINLNNDKILEDLKLELSKENNKYSIEYSEIQQYKVKTMVEFLTFFSNYFFDKGQQDKVAKNPKELMKFNQEFAKFGNHLMLFAGDDTIKKYSYFRELGKTEGNEKLYLRYYSELVLSLRKDIGYTNTEINEIDFLSLWITDKREDIEKLIKGE